MCKGTAFIGVLQRVPITRICALRVRALLLPVLALAALAPAQAEPTLSNVTAEPYFGAPARQDNSGWLGGILDALRLDIIKAAAQTPLDDSHYLQATGAEVSTDGPHILPAARNSERGSVRIHAKHFVVSERVWLAADWIEIEMERPAWADFDLESGIAEKQLRLSVQILFGDSNK